MIYDIYSGSGGNVSSWSILDTNTLCGDQQGAEWLNQLYGWICICKEELLSLLQNQKRITPQVLAHPKST